MPGDLGDFSAIGVYNQFVYVNPSTKTVVVKLSCNQMYATEHSEAVNASMRPCRCCVL